jgi:hypothetical protein
MQIKYENEINKNTAPVKVQNPIKSAAHSARVVFVKAYKMYIAGN